MKRILIFNVIGEDMKRIFASIALILSALLLTAGCAVQTQESDKLQIVATIFPPYDFTRQIAADKADITLLIRPGTDMHTYEPTVQDMEAVQNRIGKIKNNARGGADKKAAEEYAFLEKLYAHLESEKPARNFEVPEEDAEYMRNLFLLTSKPVIYAANIKESDMGKEEDSLPFVVRVKEFAAREGSEVLVICAKTEEELSQMEPDDKAVFMEEFGLGESGLDRLIKKSYSLLGLISYLTAGEKETRAWTIAKGTKAPQAAGKIHSDFEKGFIRADVVNWETLVELGSIAAAKEKGKVRSEGKEYVMQDGDVVEYYFNVSKSSK